LEGTTNIILLEVLHECDTWALTLREGHRMRVLKRIFGLRRDQVRGE
jgi:hypothetical protein